MHSPPPPERPVDETRSLTVINRSGDSSLAWSPENDDVMRGVIQEKIDQGFAFFVLKKRLGGLLPDRRERVTNVEAALASRKLVMADSDFAAVVGGGVRLIKSPSRPPLRDGDASQSRSAAEISVSQCYAVAPMAGG